ncbi:MAG TPA: hypothetical protein VJB59_07225 [Bdellovibrionota bacterium]|nr:hypothetical protein [Bdellovibrionota bacterium]
MRNVVGIGALLASAFIAGCGGAATTATDTVVPPAATPLTISGRLASTRSEPAIAFLARGAERTGSTARMSAVTVDDLLVSCVTFSVPPLAGTGGDVNASGDFNVQFAADAKGKNFGCFVTAADPEFEPIPMVFIDQTKKTLSGTAAKSSRLAVQDSVAMPAISLDLDERTVEVDVATIESAADSSQTGSDVLSAATGTKMDFTGEYVVADPVAEGITPPTGYRGPFTYAELITDEGKGGPMKGMHLYFQRFAAKKFAPTNAAACATAQETEHDAPTLLAGACTGATTTDDVFGIALWGPDMDSLFTGGLPTEAEFNAALAGAIARDSANTCKRKLGLTAVEGKVYGGVDFTTDPNYDANTAGGEVEGKYYEGGFPFPTTLNMSAHADKANVFGDGKSLNNTDGDFISALTEGWKFAEAQLRWSNQNCMTASITLGTRSFPVWRCWGKYSAEHRPDAGGGVPDFSAIAAKNAYRDSLGGGCYIVATNEPINFGNWTDFWSDTGSGFPAYTNLTQFGGVNLPAGFMGGKYVKTAFMPNSIQGGGAGTNLLTEAADIACENFEGFFMANATPVTPPADSHWAGDYWHFQYDSAGGMGTKCSALASDTDAEKLQQLRCYADAYWDPSRYLTGCKRGVDFNFNAQNPWDFLQENGPTRASSQFIFEMFNYTANDAGNFTTQEVYTRGFETKDAAGMFKWINCRVRENLSISVTAVNGNANKLLADFTSVTSLVDTFNGACVAEADKGLDGQLQTGTLKMMFVLNKQP